MQDVNAGLIGAMVITRRGMANADGRLKNVAHEFVSLFMIFDENQSWFLDYNVQHHTDDPKGMKKDEMIPVGDKGRLNLTLPLGFGAVNLRSTINGFQDGNMPMMTMKQGDPVR